MTKPRTFHIAVIGGDGIGPEVVEAAMPAIERAARLGGAVIEWERLPYGADHFLKTGGPLPDGAFQPPPNKRGAALVGAGGGDAPPAPPSHPPRNAGAALRVGAGGHPGFRIRGLGGASLPALGNRGVAQ